MERSDSRERSLGAQLFGDLTVVSGHVECFLVLTILALLGIAFRILGILE